jgi:hypothetical protein
MRHHDNAVGEQLRSLICPIEGIENGKSGSRATLGEITGFRRRTEDILIDMIDRRAEESSYDNPEPIESPMKKSSHKQRRGHRSLEAQERRRLRRY